MTPPMACPSADTGRVLRPRSRGDPRQRLRRTGRSPRLGLAWHGGLPPSLNALAQPGLAHREVEAPGPDLDPCSGARLRPGRAQATTPRSWSRITALSSSPIEDYRPRSVRLARRKYALAAGARPIISRMSAMPAITVLMDQQFAMEWVKDNIASFGGDPDQGDHLRRVGRRLERPRSTSPRPKPGLAFSAGAIIESGAYMINTVAPLAKLPRRRRRRLRRESPRIEQ